MMHHLLKGLLALILLLSLACKEVDDGASGGTSGAALYVYDSTTSAVLVWTDLSALYDGASTAVTPSKQITSTVFSSKITSLAWGGLCFDRQRGYLYLVSDTGNIVRVGNIRTQSGAIATSSDVVSFSLSDTGRLSSSTFGQVGLDLQNDILYITEANSNSTQIWVVNNASSQIQGVAVPRQTLQMSGDTGGTGVVADSGSVYAFMESGDTVGTLVTYSGPRLRKGTSSTFTAANTIIGDLTLLGKYGSLALDPGNGYLFVARHNTDAGATTAPIQIFSTGMFGQAYNQASTGTVGSAADQKDLRVIAHAGTKDWLVGLRGNGSSTAYDTIYLWKSPKGGTAAKVITATSGSRFKGAAIDGNAS